MSRTHRKLPRKSWIRYRLFKLQWPNVRWYDKYIKPKEEVILDAENQLNRWRRDGRDGMTCTTSNTGYKYDAKKTVRRANKSFCRHVLCGDDYENIPLPTRKIGKKHKWDWY